MKFTTIAAVFCIAAACFAGNSFKLTFPAKKMAPIAKSRVLINKATINESNFIAIPGGKFAFVLSDKNAAEKQTPTYIASGNFPFAAGSVEATFKVVKRVPKTMARLLHVFAPAADKQGNKNLLIYYMFITTNGDGRMGIQVGTKQFLMSIPGKSFKADTFNTFKMTWNATTVAVYLNGKKVTERALPPEFAKAAAVKRGWSTLGITPIYGQENWQNRIAIASLDIKPAK